MPEPHDAHRRFLARPRRFGTGLAISIGVHAGIVLVFLLVWSLLPLPPIQPIKITRFRDPPTRSEIGVDANGRPGPDFGSPSR